MCPEDWMEDHGDRLFSEGRVTAVSPPSWRVILGLLVLCLIPRLWAGTLHDVLCPDAVSYVGWTEAFEAGDWPTAFEHTGVNIYPPLLLMLKKLPGDWLVAAKWWSVGMAILAILPLYGWIRRQFNETLAIVGAGLYALHPALIHDCPLVIRDPSFWLLFALGLYLSWRAVSELRYRWFVGFAIIFGLAIHLRTEGWLMAPILVLWVAFRLRNLRERRFHVALAVLASLAIGPLIGQIAHAVMIAPLAQNHNAGNRHVQMLGNLVASSTQTPFWVYLDGTGRILVRYVKAMGYVHLLLAATGIAYWRQQLLGPSKGPLLLFCLLSVAAVWVCFCRYEMDRRYVYPVLMAGLPTMAAGLCYASSICGDIARFSSRSCRDSHFLWVRRVAAFCAILLGLMIVTSPRPMLYDHAAVGQWIRSQLGPGQQISISIPWPRLVSYYSEGTVIGNVPPDSVDSGGAWLSTAEPQPSVILIWLAGRASRPRSEYQRGIRTATELGYHEVPSEELPNACRQVLVLVRGNPNQ